jgi:glycosyltransferase involved in cell wall biosynthesis
VHDRLSATGTRGTPRRLLVISPWETVWSLGRENDVKAGVSDDDRFIDGFTRAGWDLHFLRPRGRRVDPRVTTHAYPNFFRATRRLPVAARRALWPALFHAVAAPRAISLSRALRPDVVMGHSHYATLAAWWCRRATGAPAVTKLFGVMDLVHTEWPAARYLAKNFEQLAALRCPQDAWIVLDDGTRGGEILRARGIPAERIHFLPNGLDLDWLERREDRAAARGRFRLPGDAPVVLFLARLVDSKRPLDVIAAFSRVVRTQAPGAWLVMAGDGPLRAACEHAARAEGVADRVRFAGVVPHDDVPALMAASDLFVSTSPLTNRALPTCEAMICGVPVAVYDTGDTSTVVRDGETGRLVKDGDIEALAASIGALLGDAGLRGRLAAAARERARTTFVSWDRRIAMEIEILGALAEKNSGRPVSRPPAQS